MDRPKIYVTRAIPQPGLALLEEHCAVEVNPHDRPLGREEFLSAISGKDGVLCLLTDRVDAGAFDAAPGIRGFANFAVGYDNMDVPEATRRRIPLSNTPDVLTEATAELAWTLLFAVSRRLVEADRIMRSGRWPGWGPMQFIGAEVQGATLGIVGAGRIGKAMARKSLPYGMRVLYSGHRPDPAFEEELGARHVPFDELVASSDYVSLHAPLTSETRHLFTYDVFAKMKRNAYLVNTARGPLVKEDDLVAALKDRLIAGAALDVYEREPIMASGLAELENVVLAPHIGSATEAARNGMALLAAKNLLAMVRGERAPNCLNPGVYG